MAPKGPTTTLAERVEIGERWEAGQKDPEIAAAMGLPVSTVRKWRRIYKKEGRDDLVSRMGRPPTGALGQFPLEKRLDSLNTRVPSRSLAGQAPLVANPEAQHSGRPFRLEWEEAMLDMRRVYEYLAPARWFRRTSSAGKFSLGALRYGLGNDFANQILEVTVDAQTQKLVCLSEDGRQKTHFLIQGLTKSNLMGELSPPDFETRSPTGITLFSIYLAR
ncbi:MAG: helix-turn-helix domain-containing protein [Anaerolineae bacterium]|jgi:hypothetical protein